MKVRPELVDVLTAVWESPTAVALKLVDELWRLGIAGEDSDDQSSDAMYMGIIAGQSTNQGPEEAMKLFAKYLSELEE